MFKVYNPSRHRGFLPPLLPNLELWLAADKGFALDDGDPVATWYDQSGNGNHATQAVGAARPIFRTPIINGLPVVRFDGVDDCFTFVGNTNLLNGGGEVSVFLVTFPDGPGTQVLVAQGDHMIYTGNAAGPAGIYAMQRDATWEVIRSAPGSAGTGLFEMFVLIRDGIGAGGTRFFIGGVRNDDRVAIPNFGVAQNSLGIDLARSVGRFWLEDMAEVIIYHTALDDRDRGYVEDYLTAKYGI